MPYIYVKPKPKKKPKTHPGLASLVATLATVLASDVSRVNFGVGDIAISFIVLYLMWIFRKLL